MILKTSHSHCKLLKTQQYLLSELSGVPFFENEDCLVKPNVDNFLGLPACFAAKCIRKVK